MEHHKPHPSAVFEGYYSKFDLPSGGNIALVACRVQNAKDNKPFMVAFTYVPLDPSSQTFQKEIWPQTMEMKSRSDGFEIDIPGTGSINWKPESTEYNISCPEFSFHAKSFSRTPWSNTTSTPESFLVRLPLPLHWHVQSLNSKCHFELEIPDYDSLLPQIDRSGEATVHDEKNWANSFPSAHMWLQARSSDNTSSFCCAGGQILGMEAFLLGYRSSDLNFDFRPPFAVRVAGWSPFMTYSTDWEGRTFEASIQNLRRKITIKASAPVGSFFSLWAPFKEGFQENFLGESFRAKIEIRVFESDWWFWGPWKLVRAERFENASLEFGGGYYPPAGSEQRFN